MPAVAVTLLTKPGCHLCDDARAIVEPIVAEVDGVVLKERSILDDLNARYWDEIPVVLIDGAVHTIWRVDPARLRSALQEATA